MAGERVGMVHFSWASGSPAALCGAEDGVLTSHPCLPTCRACQDAINVEWSKVVRATRAAPAPSPDPGERPEVEGTPENSDRYYHGPACAGDCECDCFGGWWAPPAPSPAAVEAPGTCPECGHQAHASDLCRELINRGSEQEGLCCCPAPPQTKEGTP